jgi:hypothetical protein
MEAWWHTVRNVYARDGFNRDVAGVEDHEIGGFVRRVDDVAHHPALAFGGIGAAWHEYKFAGHLAGTEIVRSSLACHEVVTIKRLPAEESVLSVRFALD